MSDLITTPEALAALPHGTILRDRIGFAVQRIDPHGWFGAWARGEAVGVTLPATVLFRPDAPTPTPADAHGNIWDREMGYQGFMRSGALTPADGPDFAALVADVKRSGCAVEVAGVRIHPADEHGTDLTRPTPAGDDQREALARLAEEWEADVERLVALGTNYDDGAAAQAAHCAAHLRVVLAAHPSAPPPVGGDDQREALARRLYETARHTGQRIAHGAEPWEAVGPRGREVWYAVADAARLPAPTVTTPLDPCPPGCILHGSSAPTVTTERDVRAAGRRALDAYEAIPYDNDLTDEQVWDLLGRAVLGIEVRP